jgi:poly(ADP-ribose) glycohydrolase ARH3
MSSELKAKYIGAMVGSALGDAIGELAFQCPEQEPLKILISRTAELVYTDDTAMAIGVAESLLEKRGINQQHLGETFSRNFFREPWRGYASGPPAIFSRVRTHGLSYVEAAKALFDGSGSFGNGAAMRIGPVGLFSHRTKSLYDEACASAEVTHAHPVGKDGAAVLAVAIAQALKLNPEEKFGSSDFLSSLVLLARTPEIRKKIKSIQTLLAEQAPPHVAVDRLGRSVAVDESMPFALYSFLLFPESFEACLFCAVLNGGDRDTLGAMAGTLSGAYLGIEAIPNAWRRKLENRKIIEHLASSLWEMTPG